MRSAGSRPLVIYIQIQIWWSLLDFNPKPIEFKLKNQCKCRSFWMKPCTSLWLNSPGKANLGVNAIFPLFLSMQNWYFKKITINCWTAFRRIKFVLPPCTINSWASQECRISSTSNQGKSARTYFESLSSEWIIIRVTHDYDWLWSFSLWLSRSSSLSFSSSLSWSSSSPQALHSRFLPHMSSFVSFFV